MVGPVVGLWYFSLAVGRWSYNYTAVWWCQWEYWLSKQPVQYGTKTFQNWH